MSDANAERQNQPCLPRQSRSDDVLINKQVLLRLDAVTSENTESRALREQEALDLAHEHAMLEQMAESIWLTDKFVDYPGTVICTGLAIVLLFSIITVLCESYLPSPITNRDILDYADINTNLFDAREAAYAEIQQSSSSTGRIPLQSISK